MAFDFNATVVTPFSASELLRTASLIMAELVGIGDSEAGVTRGGSERHLGQVVQGGTPVTLADLAKIRIGPGRPDRHLEIVDDQGSEIVQVLVSPTDADAMVVASSQQTARGVVTGLSIALAAALIGRGTIIDNELRLIRHGNVAKFTAATHIPHMDRSIAAACEAYLDQFPQLEGQLTD